MRRSFKSKIFAVILSITLTSVPFIPASEADWMDEAVDITLKKAAPVLLDIIQNTFSDTPVGALLERAAGGDSDAQFALGLMYYEGDHVEKNHAEAAEWWRMAAENGHIESQFAIGSAYYSGDGVEQDKAEGIKWLRMAAEHGNANAKNVLQKIGIE